MTVKEFNQRFGPSWRLELIKGHATFITDSGIIVGFGPYYYKLHGPTPDGQPIPFDYTVYEPEESSPIPEKIVAFVESAETSGIDNRSVAPFLKLTPYKYVSDPLAASRPPELSHVEPKEEEQTSPTPRVRTVFSLTQAMREAMTIDGELRIDLIWFTLTLDGNNVTNACDLRITTSAPPNSADLGYQPTPLAYGQHTLSVTFPSRPGLRQTYTWSFTVSKEVGCEVKPEEPPRTSGRIPGANFRREGQLRLAIETQHHLDQSNRPTSQSARRRGKPVGADALASCCLKNWSSWSFRCSNFWLNLPR